MDICKMKHPCSTCHGREIRPMSGASWLHYVDGNTENIHDQDYVTHSELFGH